MHGQIGMPSCSALNPGSKVKRETRAIPAHCSASGKPNRSKDRTVKARPPAPCQSATGTVSWHHFSEFTPNASDYTAQYADASAQEVEQPAIRQQSQAASGAAILKINVDLGLVRLEQVSDCSCMLHFADLCIIQTYIVVRQAGCKHNSLSSKTMLTASSLVV